ncbi:MAG TPA: AMP-binding protein [Beijerinckiaceae bacterium]|nr:AMP-binding protein [Beijerinckiaceae bacterium]
MTRTSVPEHYDRQETRSAASRENTLFRDLRGVLKIAKPRAPALRAQLKGIDLESLKTRSDLAAIPVVRKSDLKAMQEETPPFGGLTASRASTLKRLLVSPGPIFEPEGHAKDWWGAARAFFAAGFRKGDIVINCFSYHLTPGGHIMESGALALGCPVIPAGVGNTDQQVEAIRYLKPAGYAGTPDFLKILLDRARELKSDGSSIKRALVSGAALPGTLRKELKERGVTVYQNYGTADLGVIAYESEHSEGMIVNEGLIVEIVRPGTGEPIPIGEVGEVVVTRLNADYPLLRFATGDLSAFLPGTSRCGRTNRQLKGWLGRADQTTKVKGMFVHPSQIAEVQKHHPELIRVRLVVTRKDERDVMTLRAEAKGTGNGLCEAVGSTLQAVTKLRGAVEVVAPGTLPNDGKVIADERPVG